MCCPCPEPIGGPTGGQESSALGGVWCSSWKDLHLGGHLPPTPAIAEATVSRKTSWALVQPCRFPLRGQ